MKKNKFSLKLRSSLPIEDLSELVELITGKNGKACVCLTGAAEDEKLQPLGEILVEEGAVSRTELNRVLKEHKRIGEVLVEAGVTTPVQVSEALEKQKKQKEVVESKVRSEKFSNIRVSSDRLDKLFNLIGELVTVQERLSQVAGVIRKVQADDISRILQEFDLEGISEEICMLTNSLRDNALSIRMLPIEATFNKFKRLVHDLSVNLGKEIDLTMSGSETEIDKAVIDKLDEPLMHMIRNCADHGIEMPDIREAHGKPRRGRIHLSAEHVAGNVVIHVRDDGAGLNRERILQHALEKGLISPDANLSDREGNNLIFLPGFSTAAAVTSVSGRGVGMDVVRKTIEDLRGSVEVFSTPGQGSQIDIMLPLTLAIIDGLLVNIGGQAFVLPLSVVEECVELRRSVQEKSTTGGKLANVRGALIPYIRLREVFKIPGEAPEIEQIVISRVKGQKIGLVVDTVVGEHKTVIKSLGRAYRDSAEFSGATIMGDGSIAIIIDVTRLV